MPPKPAPNHASAVANAGTERAPPISAAIGFNATTAINRIGLFAGAIIGGIVGVAASVWLAAQLRLLDHASYGATFLGGLLGFILAALIAVKNLHGPLIPMASVGLIGLGSVLGKTVSRKHAA